MWDGRFKSINHIMEQAASCFRDVANSNILFEEARNNLCSLMHAKNEQVFPYGTKGTSVTLLADTVLEIYQERRIKCTSCGLTSNGKAMPILLEPNNLKFETTQSAFENAVMDHTMQLDCMRNVRDSGILVISVCDTCDTITKMRIPNLQYTNTNVSD